MNKITEWNGYDAPQNVYVFQVDGVWLPGYIAVVASNEHLARSLIGIHTNKVNDGAKPMYGHQLPPLVAVLPVNQTCAVTVWNGDC